MEEVCEIPRENASSEENKLPDITEFDKCEAMDADKVKNFLIHKVPAEHLDKINSINYTDKDDTDNGTRIFGYCNTNMNTLESDIEINRDSPDGCYDREELKNTMCHEIGHNVYYNMDSAERDNWADISDETDDSSIREDFADSYARYITYPEALFDGDRDKYDFMREKVFHGREYR